MFRATLPASVVMVSKVSATEFLQKLMYVQVLKVKQLKHFIFPQAQYIKQLLDVCTSFKSKTIEAFYLSTRTIYLTIIG